MQLEIFKVQRKHGGRVFLLVTVQYYTSGACCWLVLAVPVRATTVVLCVIHYGYGSPARTSPGALLEHTTQCTLQLLYQHYYCRLAVGYTVLICNITVYTVLALYLYKGNTRQLSESLYYWLLHLGTLGTIYTQLFRQSNGLRIAADKKHHDGSLSYTSYLIVPVVCSRNLFWNIQNK